MGRRKGRGLEERWENKGEEDRKKVVMEGREENGKMKERRRERRIADREG